MKTVYAEKYHAVIPTDDPYSPIIGRWLLKEFPSKSTTGDDLFEVVFDEVIGTKQTRYGPRPQPEAQVAMREVIRTYIAQGRPIPFMVPWGSEKPDGSGVDVGELGALRTLACLNDRIAAHYSPGAEFNLRVEDLSAPHQFFDRADQAREEAARYTSGLIGLNYVLGTDTFIHVSPDSSHGITEEEFNAKADLYVEPVRAHLSDINDLTRFEALHALGWDKPLAPETVAHYMHGYEKLYPGRSLEAKQEILARYFAGGLARKEFGLTGARPEWGGQYLELYFGKTPPGLAPSRYHRRIHYRTLPMEFTQNHIAPWRSKGYLEVDEHSEVVAKLAAFSALPRGLINHSVAIRRGDAVVRVQADYLLTS